MNKTPDFSVVTEFEKRIAQFFGAPFAVAVDSCTHGIELCLRLTKAKYISCPRNTYLSIPMLADKLNIPLFWREKDLNWMNYYEVYNNIYDAAVLWKAKSYINGSMMCVSMQYQKHLSVGRLGVILIDNEERWLKLKKMSYDGRLPNTSWRDQNIDTFGFHYYAQPELCTIALNKLQDAIDSKSRQWVYTDWVDLINMTVFKNKYQKIYNQIVEKAQLEKRIKKKGVYYESHHIIPRCLGGSDKKDNIVLLTAREHFIIHKLLCLIFPNEYKFKIAVWKMAACKAENQNRDYLISSKEFDRIKQEMAEVSRVIQLERWSNFELRELQSIKGVVAQLKSYQNDPDRAKRLSRGQIQSYEESDRALRLSKTQKDRYKNPEARIKTSIAVKKSRTPKLLQKMSKRFKGKGGSNWNGYVYIFNPEGKLEFKFETVTDARKSFKGIIKNGRVSKKGKYKGYKFIISKEHLPFRTKKKK